MTTERIRDKFAASKLKGLWIGDAPPLDTMSATASLRKTPLRLRGWARSQPILKSGVYQILGNSIYIGKIRHKDKIYDGEHKDIIDPAVFEQVRKAIEIGTPNSSGIKEQHIFSFGF